MADTSYRPDIDGLRAIAVLSVVFCHAGLFVPGGFVGVDVFFVISGFLITSLIRKDLAQGTFSPAEFWERRVRRIAPAVLVVAAVTLAAGWFLLLPSDYASLGESLVSLTLLGSNIHFWLHTGYFDTAAVEKPLLHTWSLAVEEQFYLLVPVLLLAVTRLRRSAWIGAMLAIAAVASLSWSIRGVAHEPSAAFYLLPYRAWELMVGALLTFRPLRWRAAWGNELMAGVGLAMILIPCALYDANTAFPGLAALLPVLGTAMLIATGTSPEPRPAINRLLAWRPLVLVGLFSYSLYLWHWPLFAFARASVSTLLFGTRASLVAASTVLGVLSWRLIELPVRRRTLFATRPRLVTAAAIASLALISASAVVWAGHGLGGRLPSGAQVFSETGALDPHFMAETEVEDVPDHLHTFGAAGGTSELVVWGDSHAMAILPAVDSLCRAAGIRAIAATHSSTAPVLGYFERRGGLDASAVPFNAAVLDYIRTRHVRTVVLAAIWRSYYKNPSFAAALLESIAIVQETGATVYFVMDMPRFAFDVPKALVYHEWHGWGDVSHIGMTVEDYEARNTFHASLLPKLRERGVRIIDPIPAFQAHSGSATLRPFDAHGSYYRDGAHLSTYGALALVDAFAPVVRGAGAPLLAHVGAE